MRRLKFLVGMREGARDPIYLGGRWIELSYGRPIKRGRDLWGTYGYTRGKDLVRVTMALTTLPYSVDQLTWAFLDMSDEGGKIAIMWDRMLAVVPFDVADESSSSQ